VHPDTAEVFSALRPIKDRDKEFVATDGTICKRKLSQFNGWRSGREGFEMDPDYYKKLNPKKVRFRDGHTERYNPSKHR